MCGGHDRRCGWKIRLADLQVDHIAPLSLQSTSALEKFNHPKRRNGRVTRREISNLIVRQLPSLEPIKRSLAVPVTRLVTRHSFW
jgi:hypothetical protein